jgi:uncharacterized membrane protein
MKAKPISMYAIIISVVIVIVYNFVYTLKTGNIPKVEDQKSIMLLGFFIIISFSPIYLNIIIDKIIEIFKKEKNE